MVVFQRYRKIYGFVAWFAEYFGVDVGFGVMRVVGENSVKFGGGGLVMGEEVEEFRQVDGALSYAGVDDSRGGDEALVGDG